MFTPIVKYDKDKLTGEYANKYPPTFKAKIPYKSLENKFDFDCYDMSNNEINFHDILGNLKGGKAKFIIQLSGIWFSAGMFGCSWKVVSAKFQQINTTKITFVADSDDEEVNDNNEDEEDDDDDDISVDNEVLAKISQKNPDKKTLVEKKVATAPATLKKKAMPAPIPQEEEDDDEEDADDADEDAADDVVVGNALGDVAEEEEDDDDDDDDDDEDDVPPPPPVKVVEPVKTETKAKKTVAKKGK
jgi:hypothetical protein